MGRHTFTLTFRSPPSTARFPSRPHPLRPRFHSQEAAGASLRSGDEPQGSLSGP